MSAIFFSAILFFSESSIADPIAAAKIHAKLGLIYLSKGFYSEAKSELMLALAEDPKHAAAWYSMAYFLEKTGDKKSAEIDYQKAVYLEPHSGAAKNNYGAYLCREKKYKQSIDLFLSAANEVTYLHSASAYNNAALCALKMGDNKSAKNYFAAALLRDPQNTIASSEIRTNKKRYQLSE